MSDAGFFTMRAMSVNRKSLAFYSWIAGRSMRTPSYTSQSSIAMARNSQLSSRLLTVLDATRNRHSVSRSFAAGVSFSAFAVVLPLATLTPGAGSAAPSESSMLPPHAAGGGNLAGMRAGAPTPGEQIGEFAFSAPAVVRATQLPAIGLVPSAMRLASITGPVASPALTPAVVVQDRVCWDDGEGNTNISVNDEGGRGSRPSWHVRYSRDNCSMELRAEGRFTLRAD
ncbi:MAG TPA: hypothetical protein VHM24_01155, partial [Gemmatimonadaceae bacterium]|nr:hypothetical protein [Gemmatimonadaceae bacterium]